MANNARVVAVAEQLMENINEHGHCVSNCSCLGLPMAVTVLLSNSQSLLTDDEKDPNSNKPCCESVDNCLELPSVNLKLTVQDDHRNVAKLNVTNAKRVEDVSQNSEANALFINDDPRLSDWDSTEVPDSNQSIKDNQQGDTSDEDDLLGTEESWSMDSAPGSYCSSLMDINHLEKSDSATSPQHLVKSGARLNNNANGYPNDDISLCSQLSDSLSSLSLQDGLSPTTTSSAYYSGSGFSQNDVTCNTFEKLEVSTRQTIVGPLRTSIFAHFPPTINFVLPEQVQEKECSLSEDTKKIMKWQLTKTTPVILKKILLSSGFRFTRKLNNWMGTWGKHMKAFEFQNLRDYQKVNHYPGTFQIGRKDRLWKNICRMQQLHSKQEFGFVPTTFVIPNDLRKLWLAWNNYGKKPRWIVKPPAAARGKGIHVIHKFAQLPKQGTFIVQRYIARPYLINGSKFDLRIYVYIPSFNPLRIYLYDDGLVRFASVKYSNAVNSLKNQFMHLTNSSVNKAHEAYTINSEENSFDGHKWSLKALWNYLSQRGVNTSEIWDNISDIIIKTVISCEPCVNILTRGNIRNSYQCHEVFGFDIMLDSSLKPWLLEVNISPSLHSSSPLDVDVKGKMLRELLNLAGFKLPAHLSATAREELAASLKIEPSFVTLDLKMLDTELSVEEKTKQRKYAVHEREEYVHDILKNLTPKDVFHLCETEDELGRAEHFQRIFPSPLTYKYHQFFCSPQYYANLLDAWETKYHHNRDGGCQILRDLCEQKIHLLNLPANKKQDVIKPVHCKRSSFVCSLNRKSLSNPKCRWLQRTRSCEKSALLKSYCSMKIRRK